MTISCIISVYAALCVGASFGFCWREIIATGAD
jgi:hypothetical protein